MEKPEIIKKLKSIKLCLEVHPDNEPNSEFADRIDDLNMIISHLKIGLEEKRKEALKKAEDAYQNRESRHYKDNERFKWAVKTINERLKV